MNRTLSVRKSLLCAVAAACAFFFALVCVAPVTAQAETDVETMYRLYNPNTGEHFYTSSYIEIGNCVVNGWRCEGGAWLAPVESNTRVYRLYNPYAGDHHYTTNAAEVEMLEEAGWIFEENAGWYSDDSHTAAVYRQYNPNATTGCHNFTTSEVEKNSLVNDSGWNDEGTGWYASGTFTSKTYYDEDALTASQAGLNVTDDTVVVYRLYDVQNGANYYTTDLMQIGIRVADQQYIFKGAAWLSPKTSNTPVHCIVNQKTWEALYVREDAEYRSLISGDWKDEGIAFYACDSETDAPVYRFYDSDGKYDDEEYTRIFTASERERKNLVKAGFNDEGAKFYVVAAPVDDDGASSTHWAVADSYQNKIFVYNSNDQLVKTIDCQFTGKSKFGDHPWQGDHTVCRKARGYWEDGACEGVNDWWVCFVDAVTDSQDGSGHLRYLGDGKYEDGAGFHYGFSGSGCVVIGNYDDAKFLYDFLDVGSTVVCK